MSILKVKKLNPAAELPAYATDGSGCFDIKSTGEGVIIPGGQRVFPTGLAFEIPVGWVLEVYSRSGHGFKNRVTLGNSVGIIDSDYRGELMVALDNSSPVSEFVVKAGDRIAQAKLVEAPRVKLVEVAELSETARGTGGLGSTGK